MLRTGHTPRVLLGPDTLVSPRDLPAVLPVGRSLPTGSSDLVGRLPNLVTFEATAVGAGSVVSLARCERRYAVRLHLPAFDIDYSILLANFLTATDAG